MEKVEWEELGGYYVNPGDGKCLDSEYTLKVEPTGFEDTKGERSLIPDTVIC